MILVTGASSKETAEEVSLFNTITVVAFKRPTYTAVALESLQACDSLRHFHQVVISIDPGYPRVVQVCEAWAAQSKIPTQVAVNPMVLGVAGNPKQAYARVFENLGSDFNVAIEDDAVLSPDGLVMALWFARHHSGEDSRYAFLNLCDHCFYRGTDKNFGGVPEDPALLAESRWLSSPFAWCFSRQQWPFIQRHWNTNTRTLLGWDWSIRFGMRIEGKIALTPVVSRCRNIGRFEGTHDTPRTWAEAQRGLNYSDGSYRGDYKVVNPVSYSDARKLSRWMIPELSRIMRRHTGTEKTR